MATIDHAPRRHRFIETMIRANGGTWPDLEQLVNALYAAVVRPGDLVLDIGVNHGTHVVHLANLVSENGLVIGVEAVPAFAAYARTLLDNAGLSRRVDLHECAVAAEAGTATFFVTKITDGGLSGLRLRSVIANDAFERIEVETKTIDMLLPTDRRVAFAKIDIEGGEYDALRGAPKLLAQQPLIAFEFNESAPLDFGFETEALLDLLWSAGYSVYDIFGFKVDDPRAMERALVWNFIAVPNGMDPVSVNAPARRLLESLFPILCDFAPV